MYYMNIFYDPLVTYDFILWFWNTFNVEAIKVFCIITIYIQSALMSAYRLVLINIHYVCPSFTLAKLFPSKNN